MEPSDDHDHLDGPSSKVLTASPFKYEERSGKRTKFGTPERALAMKQSALDSSSSAAKEPKETPSASVIAITTTTAPYLPLDLVIKILIKLPVPSILKFMCVCKQWQVLIKNQQFIKTHLSHSLNYSPPSFLIECKTSEPSKAFFTVYGGSADGNSCLLQMIPSPWELPFRHPCIVGSVHGLILVSLSKNGSESFIWNPFIKRYWKIPLETNIEYSEVDRYVNSIMGFGFDSLKNDYKVVKIVYTKKPWGYFGVGVYSLKLRSWRMLGNADEMGIDFVTCWHDASCFTNGSIHWIVREEKNNWKTFVLSFNINNESFNRMELPENLVDGYTYLFISEINGLLSVFNYKNTEDVRSYHFFKFCDIWVKKEYSIENSWIKICNIELEDQVLERVLELKENGEILIIKKQHKEEHWLELASYNSMTREIRTVGGPISPNLFYAGEYKESLLLLDIVSSPYIEPNMLSVNEELYEDFYSDDEPIFMLPY